MILKSFGCSFIWGSDFPGDLYGRRGNASLLTWPAIAARELGLEYQCYARAGSGNLSILRNVLNQVFQDPQGIFLINWTFIDRFDFGDPQEQWQTLSPGSNTELAKIYYADLHSEYRDKLCSLIYINQAMDILTSQGISYVMTVADDLLFDTQWHTDPAILHLQQKAKSAMYFFQGLGFVAWAKHRGFPISDNNHPLLEAHKIAAELMIPVINTYITKESTCNLQKISASMK